MIKGLIFDYGATIDTNGKHWAVVIEEGYRAAGVELPRALFRETYVFGERALATHPYIEPHFNFKQLMQKKIEIHFDYLHSQGVEVQSSNNAQETIADYCYRYAARNVQQARNVLDQLQEKYAMVLVSNFYGNIAAVLSDFTLIHYFDTVIESAIVGVRKPDPRIFQLGIDALQLQPDEVMVIGDSYRKDILPASTLGCCTAWLKGEGWDDDEKNINEGLVIQDFGQLKAIL